MITTLHINKYILMYISMNVRRDYRIWISQKMQKKKVLKELVFLYIYLISVLGEINKN